MKKLLLFVFLPFVYISSAGAAWFDDGARILENVYGPTKTGCIQTSVTTTGANRSIQLKVGSFYLLYCYSGSDISQGDSCACVQGPSNVDVNNLKDSTGNTLVGQKIYANQQLLVEVTGPDDQYVSCISKTATMKYDLCKQR